MPRIVGGRLAQWLAQLLYTETVGGSNPSSPTTFCRDFEVFKVFLLCGTVVDSLERYQ